MALALVGYALYPTAPPRMAVDGMVDTVSATTAVHLGSTATSFLFNPYAAVPSMHVAFALMVAVPGLALCRSFAMRLWWSAYPMIIFFVVVVTGNHYWFDAAAGAAVACLAGIAAGQLARLRPEAWSWREAPGEAAA
jgi:membrane-associated phospholipid phosphatase